MKKNSFVFSPSLTPTVWRTHIHYDFFTSLQYSLYRRPLKVVRVRFFARNTKINKYNTISIIYSDVRIGGCSCRHRIRIGTSYRRVGAKKNTAFPKTCPLTVSLFLASFANSRFQVTYYFSFFPPSAQSVKGRLTAFASD